MLGISINTFTYKFLKDILKIAKKLNPNIITVIGGLHSTCFPKENLFENPPLYTT